LSTTTSTLQPETEDELCAAVRAAHGSGTALAIEGGRSKRHYGPSSSSSSSASRVLSLARMSRIVAHEPGDMILSVEAGARLADVQRALAAHDQWLPLDPPFAEAATVGGVLATNGTGPRRAGYGTAKDHLLGMRVVGADGQVTKSGGRVVKNVSGYDLHRMQVGAFGALGVIALAHFKVCARPEVSALWALPCTSLGDAHRLLLEVGASALRPVALEALDRDEAALARAGGAAWPEDASALAVVGLEGSRASFERHARELATFAGRGAGAPAIVERPDVEPFWAALGGVPAAHHAHVRVRVGARPHDLPDLLSALELERAGTVGVTVRAASGLAYVALPGGGDAAPLAAAVARWHRLASSRAGYAVVESAPLSLANRAALPFGASAASGPAAALRAAWDPTGTLNPGRCAW
jgi:glycolate oxidase FAD binding subunit